MKKISNLLLLLCISMALCVACGDEPEITKKDNQTEESRNENQNEEEQNEHTQNEENSNSNNQVGEETSAFSAITTVEGIIETVVCDVTVNAVSLKSTIALVDKIWMTECGVCVGTSPNPTIENNLFKYSYTRNGKEEERCFGLPSNTSCFARTYVINDLGVNYGNVVEFKTLSGKVFSYQTGEIPAYFSVSRTEKVAFSKGNLQYHCANKEWRFAEHQYDMIGEDNKYIFVSYNGWIDLFGWGTSGYNGRNAYSVSGNYSDYGVVGDRYADITGTNYDWGVYNKISNGGNVAGQWRTLTYEEWYYVLKGRADASSLMGFATVNGVAGLILLPDDWSTPAGVAFKAGMNGFENNIYTVNEWVKMEANGAVFLPAAGYRLYGTDVYGVGRYGDYWSSSADDYDSAYYLSFGRGIAGMRDDFRDNGRSVRLVRSL